MSKVLLKKKEGHVRLLTPRRSRKKSCSFRSKENSRFGERRGVNQGKEGKIGRGETKSKTIWTKKGRSQKQQLTPRTLVQDGGKADEPDWT